MDGTVRVSTGLSISVGRWGHRLCDPMVTDAV